MPDLRVRLSSGNYPIVVTSNDFRRLPTLLARTAASGRMFVFYDAQFYALHGSTLRPLLKARGREVIEMVLPRGEKSKSRATLERIYAFLLSEQICRDDFILAIGGGVTSDLVGYAAATTLRGIAWGVIPTTLLGMVDAAIGGKTGINHRLGKNLIGAFWHPRFVYIDTLWVNTLDRRQLTAGIGEVVKYAGLEGQPMIDTLQRYLSSPSQRTLTKLVRQSVASKARIVTLDEREKNIRMFLNFGHTFGHALEHAAGYGRLLHGEAILLGLWAAVRLSVHLKPSRAKRLNAYQDIVETLLPRIPRVRIDLDGVLTAMSYDKKRSGRKMRFVLLDRPGKVFIADNVPGRTIRDTVKRTLAVYDRLGGTDA